MYGTEEDDFVEMRDAFDQYDKEWYVPYYLTRMVRPPLQGYLAHKKMPPP